MRRCRAGGAPPRPRRGSRTEGPAALREWTREPRSVFYSATSTIWLHGARLLVGDRTTARGPGRLPCYPRRRSGAPPVGTKRSASRESCHTERNALAASPRRGRPQRSLCLAGTSVALLGVRIVSCLCSSIDRRYGRKTESAEDVLVGLRKERQKDCHARVMWVRGYARWQSNGAFASNTLYARRSFEPSETQLPVAPRLCLLHSSGVGLALPCPLGCSPGAAPRRL